MLRDFDVFEVFPDGTSIWRACVSGQFAAERKLQELAEHSDNQFLAVDARSGARLAIAAPKKSALAAKKAANG